LIATAGTHSIIILFNLNSVEIKGLIHLKREIFAFLVSLTPPSAVTVTSREYFRENLPYTYFIEGLRNWIYIY
jgi:hypothetical protein